MKPIRRILHTYINKGITSVQDISEIISKSDRTIQYFLTDDDKDLRADDIRLLALHFSARGHNELSKAFWDSTWVHGRLGVIEINGSLDDEAKLLMASFGEALRAYDKDDPDRALKAMEEAVSICNQAIAEIKLKS